jgi:hypothetical protein
MTLVALPGCGVLSGILGRYRLVVPAQVLDDEGQVVAESEVLWTETGKSPREVKPLVFSPDGVYVAAIFKYWFQNPDVLRIWRVGSGREFLELPVDPEDLAFSPDHRFLAVATTESALIYSMDVMFNDDVAPQTLGELGPGSVDSVAFSPDGKRLAFGVGKEIALFDVRDDGFVPGPRLRRHYGVVGRLAFSPPDGRLLASVGQDNALLLWDLDRRETVLEIDGSQFAPVSFSADGKLLFHDGRVYRSGADSWTVYRLPKRDYGGGVEFAYSCLALGAWDDGGTLAVVDSSGLECWRISVLGDDLVFSLEVTLPNPQEGLFDEFAVSPGRSEVAMSDTGYDPDGAGIVLWRIRPRTGQATPPKLTSATATLDTSGKVRIEGSATDDREVREVFALCPGSGGRASARPESRIADFGFAIEPGQDDWAVDIAIVDDEGNACVRQLAFRQAPPAQAPTLPGSTADRFAQLLEDLPAGRAAAILWEKAHAGVPLDTEEAKLLKSLDELTRGVDKGDVLFGYELKERLRARK